MNKIWFTISFIVFFIIALFFNQILHNTPNITIEILVVYYCINMVLYVFFAMIILKYGRLHNFTKKNYKIIFSMFITSFLLFPIVLQLLTFVYCLRIDNKSDINEIIFEEKENNLKDKTIGLITGIIIAFIISMYFYGGYKIFNDKEYTAKHMVLGFIIPPYTVYIGVKELLTDDRLAIKDKKILKTKDTLSRSFDNSVNRKLSY